MSGNLNYKQHIILPPAIAAIVLIIAMSWVFFSAHHLLESAQRKVQISDAKYEAVKLLTSPITAENSLRGYLLTGNVEFLDTYNQSAIQNDSLLNQLKSHQTEIPEIAPLLVRLDTLIKNKFGVGQVALQIQLSAGSYAPHLRMATNNNKLIMDKIRMEIRSLDLIMQNESDKVDRLLAETLNQLKVLSLAIVLLMSMILIINYKRTVWLFEHASSIEELAEQFGHLALHDTLTKLPNRRNFEQYLKQAISQAGRSKQKVGLLYMDLDGFKLINDQYGHDAGDKALITAVERINKTLRDSDFFARIGGDEFVLVANHFHDKNELQVIANRIIEALNQAVFDNPADKQVFMGISIGIAIYPDHVKSAKTLITAADQAMYEAKTSGKNQAHFYHS
jgi:diguanylate cyclase (GGDEF)-like protein